MALADRTIKQGDSFPPHVRVLEDDDGIPLDLPAAATVRFLARMGPRVGGNLIDADCQIVTVQEALDTGWLEATVDEAAAWQPYLDRRAGAIWNINPADTAIAGAFPYEYEVLRNPAEADPALRDIETIPNRKAANPVLTIDEDNG